MWGLIAEVVLGFGHYLEACAKAEWHARQNHGGVIDWMRRQRLGIPPIAEDIT